MKYFFIRIESYFIIFTFSFVETVVSLLSERLKIVLKINKTTCNQMIGSALGLGQIYSYK
jgi:hypothetical protein